MGSGASAQMENASADQLKEFYGSLGPEDQKKVQIALEGLDAKSAEAPQTEAPKADAPKAEEASKVDEAPNAEEAPKAEESAKPDEPYAQIFGLGEAGEDWGETQVYHCTSPEAANSILAEGFRFPIKGVSENKGWKLGYAVYFGANPQYCVHEALNTFRDAGKSPDPEALAMIRATVKKGKFRALGGPYDSLSEKCQMSRDRWDQLTEQIDSEIVAAYGLTTLTINDGMDEAEVVVYDKSTIVDMKILSASEFLGAEGVAPEPQEDELDKKLKPAFQDIDKNNSGFIEANELKLVLQQMGVDMGDDDVQGVFKLADVDGDKKLNYAEYRALVGKAMK